MEWFDAASFWAGLGLGLVNGIALVCFTRAWRWAGFTLGHASYEDAKEEQDMYCKMVTEKTWPDYNQNFERICK